jgi:hypothetical protein
LPDSITTQRVKALGGAEASEDSGVGRDGALSTAQFRDMLVTSRDRVEKLKSAGKSAQKAVAEKPFADIDTMWGEGIINSEQRVQIVYLILRISAEYFSDEQSVTLIRKEEQQ